MIEFVTKSQSERSARKASEGALQAGGPKPERFFSRKIAYPEEAFRAPSE